MPAIDDVRKMHLNKIMNESKDDWNYIHLAHGFDVVAHHVHLRIHLYLYKHTYPSGRQATFFTAYPKKPASQYLIQWIDKEIKDNE